MWNKVDELEAYASKENLQITDLLLVNQCDHTNTVSHLKYLLHKMCICYM